MVENNYIIKKSDVLVGSSFLKKRDDNGTMNMLNFGNNLILIKIY